MTFDTEEYTHRKLYDKHRNLIKNYYEQSSCMKTGQPFTKKFEFYDLIHETLGTLCVICSVNTWPGCMVYDNNAFDR